MSKDIVRRKSGRERRRITIYLPPELDKSLRLYCAEHYLELSVAVEQAVEAYLERMTFKASE